MQQQTSVVMIQKVRHAEYSSGAAAKLARNPSRRKPRALTVSTITSNAWLGVRATTTASTFFAEG
jgi:hypothetical protein